MVYEMVVEYVRTAKYRVVNGVRVYDKEKIILVDIGEYYVLIQAHDNTTWVNLLSTIMSSPGLVRELARVIHDAVDTLIPGTISIMYLRKKDVLK